MPGPRKTPAWAPQDRNRWPAGCTPHRDGWVRSYKGQTRFVCGKRTPLNEVVDRWIAKKKQVDGELVAETEVTSVTLRELTAEFLAVMKKRVTGGNRTISQRTYHNYVAALNDFGAFVGGDVLVDDIGPQVFASYAERFRKWKASGFDSVVCRVSALFRWGERMEMLERFRPGPQFVRPAKQDIRDERLSKTHSFTPEQIAELYHAANATMQCWIALGVCAGFSNSDIANMPRTVIDLETGVIDYRRRKKGKIRRVIPLPADVVDMLKSYRRPDPAEERWGGLFFLTRNGRPYAHSEGKPTDAISHQFSKLVDKVLGDIERSFRGLRTTLYNLWPRGYEQERMIVMGRAQGTIDLDHYLETVHLDRLRHSVDHVWTIIKNARQNLQTSQDAPVAASASELGTKTDAAAASPQPQTV